MKVKRIYLDHNATSPISPHIAGVLAEAFERFGGNASSPHAEGQSARLALEKARETIAELVAAEPEEVVFTSGGTESNNACIFGAGLGRAGSESLGLVVSSVEHPSVLEPARELERAGASLSILPAGEDGRIDPLALQEALDTRPAKFVSVMHVNNETGVIQPIEDLARIARERDAVFHCDMVQSAGKIDIKDPASRMDMVSLASHKIGGPAGIGALIVSGEVPWHPMLRGGAQEGRRRAGTEPVALAVGFAEAVRRSTTHAGEATIQLRKRLESGLQESIPGCVIHGGSEPRVPNTSSFYLPGVSAQEFVVQMDLQGFAISTGSACSTGSFRPSHVLEAMGCSREVSAGTLRVSLGTENTSHEIEQFLEAVKRTLAAGHVTTDEAASPASMAGVS
jgi:cysteine desulfurase